MSSPSLEQPLAPFLAKQSPPLPHSPVQQRSLAYSLPQRSSPFATSLAPSIAQRSSSLAPSLSQQCPVVSSLEQQSLAHYLAERLEAFPVRVTQLAHGLPVGGELDYLDEGTLAQALRARRPVQ